MLITIVINAMIRLTYHLTKLSDGQVLVPDFVLYLEILSTVNFFFSLCGGKKKKKNYRNSNLEDDLVKLGKEMQVALNKLVRNK